MVDVFSGDVPAGVCRFDGHDFSWLSAKIGGVPDSVKDLSGVALLYRPSHVLQDHPATLAAFVCMPIHHRNLLDSLSKLSFVGMHYALHDSAGYSLQMLNVPDYLTGVTAHVLVGIDDGKYSAPCRLCHTKKEASRYLEAMLAEDESKASAILEEIAIGRRLLK